MLVSDLKNIASKDFNINPDQIRLQFAKEYLAEDKHLYEYKIANKSVIYLIVKLKNACFEQNTNILTTLNG
jgi:hypothetical protein